MLTIGTCTSVSRRNWTSTISGTFVVPLIVDVQSRRETEVHVPMMSMGRPRRIFVYLYGVPLHMSQSNKAGKTGNSTER
jgi:hypothetical protein